MPALATRHYLRRRPVLSAFPVMPVTFGIIGAVGFLTEQTGMPWPAALVAWFLSIVAGLALSRALLQVLLGDDGVPAAGP